MLHLRLALIMTIHLTRLAGNLSKTAISKFAWKNANYDVANVTPGDGTFTMGGYSADQAGTAKRCEIRSNSYGSCIGIHSQNNMVVKCMVKYTEIIIGTVSIGAIFCWFVYALWFLFCFSMKGNIMFCV